MSGNANPTAAEVIADTITIPAPPQPAPSMTSKVPENYFTAEQVEAIRQQEKEKLYGRLTSEEQKAKALQEQLDQFNAEREAAAQAARDAQAAADAERKRREEEELSAKELVRVKEEEWKAQLSQVEKEFNARLAAADEERKAAAALLEREREFQALETYKNRRLAEEAANMTIMPDLMDLVRGNTEDEIEASISALVEKTSAIVENIQQNLPPQKLRGVSPVGGAPIGPLDNYMEQQTFTESDLKALTVEQYAKIRDRLLPAATPRGRY